MTGRVYLVGAGCGEADLITLRGLSLLRSCDAVVYDDLLDDSLLDAVPAEAERIYAGKRAGRPSAAQEDITALLIRLARAGKTVVRLKGGDPFVFGRGGEELLGLLAAGVPCQEVPGVSSAVAVPALAGIPVTHRAVSREVHIVTARAAGPDTLPAMLERLAKLPGTLVFLMGLSRLSDIAAGLTAAGMDPDTPAAVVSGENAAGPRAVRGTLRDIAALASAAGAQPPATIVVGAVAAMDLSPTIGLPLSGVTAGVTGTAAVTDKLCRALREQGAEAFLAERSLIRELPAASEAAALLDGRRRWVAFTSANGVRVFFRRLRGSGIDLRRLASCRFAVIGGGTAAALAEYGLRADLCPEETSVEALGRLLAETVPDGEEIVLYRSRRGDPALARRLAAAGRPVRDVAAYDLEADGLTAERAKAHLRRADYVVFSSASGVALFWEQQGGLPPGAVPVCIGEATGAALARRSPVPYLTAKRVSAQGLVDAILEHRGRLNHADHGD